MAHGILIAGLLLVLIGSEVAMRGGVGLARAFDLPPLVTGVVVIATLTVAPELFVTIRAVTMGRPELALGGLVGAIILNLTFVLGLGALIQPMASPPKVVFRDGTALLIAALGVLACALTGALPRWAGVAALLGFALYIAVVFATDWRRAPEHSVGLARALYRSRGEIPSTMAALLVFVLGLAAMALGAHLGVWGARELADELGWSEATIGLIVLAAGLSAPKFLTTLYVAIRGDTVIAVGALLSAAVFCLTLVLGLIVLFQPMPFPPGFAAYEIPILTGITFVLILLLAMRWRLSRLRGLLLILAYGCYLGFLLWRQGLPLPWGLSL